MAELSNVELNIKEITKIVINNLGKMFYRRGYTLDNNIPEKIVDIIINDKVYDFELECPDNTKKKISINILNQEIKNISNGSISDEYLNKNIDYHKFLIVKSFSKKTYTQIVKEYKNAEIFTIYELLEDIPSKEFIPEHKLLDNNEKKELLESFGLSELGRIYSTDIMARYYGAKLNDVFRIIRPNISSGTSIYYRLVINGSLDVFN